MVARERVVRAAIRDAHLRVLAPSAAAPGFARAAGALFAELQRSLVEPARFTRALRAWGGVAYADELAALYSAYRRRLEALGRPDRDGEAWAVLDALRADPGAWGRRPVFVYGFDELTRAQLDAVETLGRLAEADVWVTLPYEPGRHALAGSAATVHELAPLAEVVALDERAEHYAAAARPALHHLERGLFEGGAETRPPNGAVRLLEAGGERAEAEIVGAEVLELMRDGVAAEDIAVLVRGAGPASLFAQVLGTYGIPVAWSRQVPLARTRLGAGVLAGARAALAGGRAEDLLAWLRLDTGGRGSGRRPRGARAARRGGRRSGGGREVGALGAAAARRACRRGRGRGGGAARGAGGGGGRGVGGSPRAARRRARPGGARRGAGGRGACAPRRPSCARWTRSCWAAPRRCSRRSARSRCGRATRPRASSSPIRC